MHPALDVISPIAVDPLEARFGATTAEAILALQAIREMTESKRAAAGIDPGIGYRIEEVLLNLIQAADAMAGR